MATSWNWIGRCRSFFARFDRLVSSWVRHFTRQDAGNETMNLDQLFIFVERLRKEAIGEPRWIKEKKVYEYSDQSAKCVAVLKLVRAAQGVSSVNLLWEHGLFVDLGVIIRCVHDCQAEIYFLLEEFPKTSSNVDQFVKSFFESTIDGYLSMETHSVQTKKIRNAMLRVLESDHDDEMRTRLTNTRIGAEPVIGPCLARTRWRRPGTGCAPSPRVVFARMRNSVHGRRSAHPAPLHHSGCSFDFRWRRQVGWRSLFCVIDFDLGVRISVLEFQACLQCPRKAAILRIESPAEFDDIALAR
jgi:hypothetical protein